MIYLHLNHIEICSQVKFLYVFNFYNILQAVPLKWTIEKDLFLRPDFTQARYVISKSCNIFITTYFLNKRPSVLKTYKLEKTLVKSHLN